MINPLDVVQFIPKKFQLTAAIAIIAAIGGGYLAYKYTSALGEVELVTQQKEALETAHSEVVKSNSELKTKYDNLESDYQQAIKRYQDLNNQFTEINDKYRESLTALNKEKDRFDDLLQKRTSAIVRAANRRIKQLRDELENAINDSEERADQGNMP